MKHEKEYQQKGRSWRGRSDYDSFDYPYSRDYDQHDRGHRGLWETMKEGAKYFFGIGPKEYRRSDERIREDVCDALTRDPAVDASQIQVTVNDGRVTLNGTVGSRWMKRRAEDCAEELSGVSDVRNELDIRQENQWSFTNTSTKTTMDTESDMDKRKLS